MDPRYPTIRVRTRSGNPYALVAAVRYALWKARVSDTEIDRFTRAALEGAGSKGATEVCREWVRISAP